MTLIRHVPVTPVVSRCPSPGSRLLRIPVLIVSEQAVLGARGSHFISTFRVSLCASREEKKGDSRR